MKKKSKVFAVSLAMVMVLTLGISANTANAVSVRNQTNGNIITNATLLSDGDAFIFDDANAHFYQAMQYREYMETKYGESVVEQAGVKSFITVFIGFNPVSPNFSPPATVPYTEYYENYMLYGILPIVPGTGHYAPEYAGYYAYYSGYVEEFIIS